MEVLITLDNLAYEIIFGEMPDGGNEAVSNAFKEYNNKKSFAQDVEEELDKCIGAPADWYEYELKRLLYPLDRFDNVNFETGKLNQSYPPPF
ncbi:hypothetical protein [Laceyella putida]|uniref:Uncharacterized protein n=2 Tax=Laceyella putida TaxID=110101 RepID=A0ABW2RPU9_9BACL